METKKLGTKPAFPLEYTGNDNYGGTYYNQEFGISKRFYAACAAMQGMLTNPEFGSLTDKAIVKTAFNMADELLKQELT